MSRWLTDEQTVVYPYKEILLKNKKGQIIGIQNNIQKALYLVK